MTPVVVILCHCTRLSNFASCRWLSAALQVSTVSPINSLQLSTVAIYLHLHLCRRGTGPCPCPTNPLDRLGNLLFIRFRGTRDRGPPKRKLGGKI
jgi:hypothetical protein